MSSDPPTSDGGMRAFNLHPRIDSESIPPFPAVRSNINVAQRRNANESTASTLEFPLIPPPGIFTNAQRSQHVRQRRQRPDHRPITRSDKGTQHAANVASHPQIRGSSGRFSSLGGRGNQTRYYTEFVSDATREVAFIKEWTSRLFPANYCICSRSLFQSARRRPGVIAYFEESSSIFSHSPHQS